MVIIYTVQNMSIIPIESMAPLGCMLPNTALKKPT